MTIVFEGKVTSKSIDKDGTIYSSIEIPDQRFSESSDTLHIKANFELGTVVEFTIYAESE